MDRVKLVFLNSYFYTLFLIASGVVIPVLTLLVAVWRIFHSHRETMKRFRRAISLYGRVITLIPYPFITVRYEDRSRNDPQEPYIFVANHRSASDAFLMCVLPHEAVQVVNVWPFRIPVLGLYAKLSGYLDIRNMPFELFLEKGMKLLREKVSLIFFPEGTRSASRTMGNFHSSAFRLALEAKAAIVPLCITGNENIPRKGSLLLRPGVVRVRRLPAIPWDEYKDLNAFALKNRVREVIQGELSLMESGI